MPTRFALFVLALASLDCASARPAAPPGDYDFHLRVHLDDDARKLQLVSDTREIAGTPCAAPCDLTLTLRPADSFHLEAPGVPADSFHFAPRDGEVTLGYRPSRPWMQGVGIGMMAVAAPAPFYALFLDMGDCGSAACFKAQDANKRTAGLLVLGALALGLGGALLTWYGQGSMTSR